VDKDGRKQTKYIQSIGAYRGKQCKLSRLEANKPELVKVNQKA